MNQSFDNVEYLPFPGHKYRVGYATLSGVWHIHGSTGAYYARCTTGLAAGLGAFHAATLAEVSKEQRVR